MHPLTTRPRLSSDLSRLGATMDGALAVARRRDGVRDVDVGRRARGAARRSMALSTEERASCRPHSVWLRATRRLGTPSAARRGQRLEPEAFCAFD